MSQFWVPISKIKQLGSDINVDPQSMDARRAAISAAEQERVEAAHAAFQQRRKDKWNDRFEEAEEFHRGQAARREANKLDKDATAVKVQKAVDENTEYQSRFAEFQAEMDEYIPPTPKGTQTRNVATPEAAPQLTQTDTLKLEAGNWKVVNDNVGEQGQQVPEGSQHIDTPLSPQAVNLVPAVEEHRHSDEGSLEDLAPIPVRRKLYEDPKLGDFRLGSVKSPSTISSLHTGDQIPVNRVPSEMIPSTKGGSVFGTYPDATVWTRSPRWAQAMVGAAMGVLIGSAGFGMYKLFGKVFHKSSRTAKDKSKRRLHPRDWTPIHQDICVSNI